MWGGGCFFIYYFLSLMRTRSALSLLCTLIALPCLAQTTSSDGLSPSYGTTDVVFSTADKGRQLPIVWGMDAAWISQENVRRGIAFIGKENIANLRVSFQPTAALVGDTALTSAQRNDLNRRISMARLLGKPDLIINSDPAEGKVDPFFTRSGRANAAHWAKLIEVSTKAYQKAGFHVITVSPFNEPDYEAWGQGTKADFKEIARLLKTDYADTFADIRISAGNTLNCDKASEWYEYMKPYVDEGCTHQLAGGFNTYAKFFQTVRADGNHATADELHNVMEAMVGAEYGMQTGIWWGFDGLARGEFCRASFGDRLAYAENRSAWAAASVYRNTLDNRIEAFLGTSERQATNSSWRFVCTDRDVYYDGYGPTREFSIDMPGGNGYQNGQTNAERVINITWGEDVPPAPVDGTYLIMNAYSGRVLALEGGSAASGTGLVQMVKQTGKKYQQWRVNPVSSRIGGDFSYHTILSVTNGWPIDVWNWSLDSGGEVRLFNGSLGTNEQWYLQYAGQGAYYIRSRYSNLCLELVSNSTAAGTRVRQGTFTGHPRQQWKFVPVDATCDLVCPAAPEMLTATPQSASIGLHWAAAVEPDVTGYMILRADASVGEWNTIGRCVADTCFIDNTCLAGHVYIYKVKAIDACSNLSDPSAEVTASLDGMQGLIARWDFEGTFNDTTANCFRLVPYGKPTCVDQSRYVASGDRACKLDGSSFLQLPYGIATTEELTVCFWMYWNGSSAGNNQHIFDFGDGHGGSLYLTPSNGTKMRFAISKDGEEQFLDATKMAALRLQHVAVTMRSDSVLLYVDGVLKASTADITLRPSDICPVLNYLGRSQKASHPLMKAYLDDFRIYNCALTADAIHEVMSSVDTAILPLYEQNDASDMLLDDSPVYDLTGRRVPNFYHATVAPGLYIVDGKKMLIN